MNTWIEHITSQHDAPVGLRTRGGIGFIQGKEVVSHFVGHPVHYLESGLWKPITLKRHANGDLEGSPFTFKAGRVTHKGKELFQPRAVIFNGQRYPIQLAWKDNRLICDFPFGTYEVQFREGGVRELLTIPEPVDAVISFDVPHAKNHGLRKKERHIVGTDIFGEEFIVTKSMGSVEIDPDYSPGTADGNITGTDTVQNTARSTSTSFSTSSQSELVGRLFLSGNYSNYRLFLVFDTSGIPDTDVVSNAVLKMVVTTDDSNQDFSVEIVKQDWSSQNPISSGNMETAFDNCLSGTLDATWRSTSGISLNTQYTSPSLDTSRVSKTGNTYYSLRSDRDFNNSSFISSREHIEIATANHGTSGYRPVLTVTHAPQTSKLFALYY